MVLVLLAVLSGFILSRLGLPASFLTGPLVAAAFFAVTNRPVIRFAATPGGLDSVAAMATDLKADGALILAVHSLRLISVVTVGPYLVQFVAQRLSQTKGGAETSES